MLAGPTPGGLHASGLPFLDKDGGPCEVHIVSGSFGAGHDAAAREIAIRLTEQGHLVHTWDVVDLFPARLGRLLRSAYLKQLDLSPASWGLLLRRLQPGGRLHRLVTRALGITARRLLAVTVGADLIVSTHPFASQSLGRLRALGRLRVPVTTYLTDLSVHSLWVHPGVDLHLALHDVAARQAIGWGGRATVIEPLVPYAAPAPLSDTARAAYRAAWGLAPDARVALVVGGSLGIGELAATAADVVASGLAVPVVVCGHNEALRARLSRVEGVVALGWREDLPALLRASDCVLQNAGGFTSLEALAAGVPVLTYRCIPGHGATNAAALEEAGLIPWARDRDDLQDQLVRALAGTWSPPLAGPAAGGAAPVALTLVDALSGRRISAALPVPA